ncbi:MAG: aminomethyl-transferring glycine dehydrogenase subunit GcvPA, partial [Gemmataceae bacterium]
MRYIPQTNSDREQMLEALAIQSVDELFLDIPQSARLNRPLQLPKALSEMELQQHLGRLAAKNISTDGLVCFLGAGFYDRFIPAAV